MIFGFRSKSSRGKHKQSYWYRLKTYEETDSALLRLLECFMEAAPQLTLQLYIVVCHGIKQNLMLGKSKARKVQSSFFHFCVTLSCWYWCIAMFKLSYLPNWGTFAHWWLLKQIYWICLPDLIGGCAVSGVCDFLSFMLSILLLRNSQWMSWNFCIGLWYMEQSNFGVLDND